MPINSDLASLLEVLVYLILGTVAIALFGGWVVKRFSPRK